MLQWIKLLTALALLLGCGELGANPDIWHELGTRAKGPDAAARDYVVNRSVLFDTLSLAPHEALGDRSQRLQLPMPDGSLAQFAIVESPVMHPDLAAVYPQIKTFKLYGIDDPTASGRADITPRGFHAMLRTVNGRVFIDPINPLLDTDTYRIRQKRGVQQGRMSCGVGGFEQFERPQMSYNARSSQRVSGMLLQYRLAVSATEEYVGVIGGGVAGAQAEIVTAINRVNEIFADDLGIFLELVPNNNLLIEVGGNAGFTNDSAFAMFAENPAWIDNQIGSGAYDIGHVFSTGGGGLAFLGSVCDSTHKAKGVTGQPNPVGDPFYIDFVAHEIGHQFNADHSFNGSTLSCGFGNRWAPTAFEPGSGTTIMGYAGICGVEDLQNNSDATFHAGSIAQINTFANSLACGAQIATTPANNADPTISPIGDRVIPIQTAFVLDGNAIDSDMPAQTLSYQWDQMNTGDSTDATTFGTDMGTNPLFRSYLPQPAGRRDFPALGTQVEGMFDDAEVMPCNARTLNFRLTARDSASGQDIEDVNVTTTAAAGPFRVSNYNTTTSISVAGVFAPLTWDISNTDIAPVNCTQVDIELLTFNDAAYSQYSVHTLMANTPNDGGEAVIFPDQTLSHPRARFRVKCSNNIFYDISGADLNIIGNPPGTLYTDTDFTTFFNNGGTVGGVAPTCGTPNVVFPIGGSGGSGAIDQAWLFLLGLIAAFRLGRRGQG